MTDITALIPKGSVLDLECAHRGASFIPSEKEDAHHLLPPMFSEEICSLQPGKDCLTLSIVLSVDAEGNALGLPDVFRSVINMKRHFTHAKVCFVQFL